MSDEPIIDLDTLHQGPGHIKFKLRTHLGEPVDLAHAKDCGITYKMTLVDSETGTVLYTGEVTDEEMKFPAHYGNTVFHVVAEHNGVPKRDEIHQLKPTFIDDLKSL